MRMKEALFVLPLLASLPCVAGQTYQVSTSIFKNSELIASPSMVVHAEKRAMLRIGNDFNYSLTLKPNADETASINARLHMGEDSAEPELTVAYGQEATVQIGDQRFTFLVNKVHDE